MWRTEAAREFGVKTKVSMGAVPYGLEYWVQLRLQNGSKWVRLLPRPPWRVNRTGVPDSFRKRNAHASVWGSRPQLSANNRIV